MPVLVVHLEPWLAAQTLMGETVPDRWRRLGVLAGFEVVVGVPDASGDVVVDGARLDLGVEALRALAAGGEVPFGDPVVAIADLVDLEDEAWATRRQLEVARGVRLVGDGQLIAPTVTLDPGSLLGPGVVLLGATHVAEGAVVQLGCHLVDTEVGPGALLKPYTVAERARIGAGTQVGPFAHLREGTLLGDGVHLGNFVETKKATLGPGAKANHLAYLGDCSVGARSNIGAGTITCNYDGARKHHTEIGEDVFVGTNSSLVAPLTIGEGALIAAGSVVVEDVPAGALVVARGRQVTTADKGRAILTRNRRLKAEGA